MAFTGVKNLPANAGDTRDAGSIPGSGKSPGVGNGNPFQYSCLENTMDRGAWWATVHGVEKMGYDWATEHHHHLKYRYAPSGLCLKVFKIIFYKVCHSLLVEKFWPSSWSLVSLNPVLPCYNLFYMLLLS